MSKLPDRPNVFFTSDLHFSHDFVARRIRGFKSIHEHDAMLIENWNSVVEPNDVVYVLGDVSLEPAKNIVHILEQLNGNKILVKGNHDKLESCTRMLRHGFINWCYGMLIRVCGRTVQLSHYPPKMGLIGQIRLMIKYGHWGAKYQRHNPEDKGQWIIHGHTHSMQKVDGRAINVAPEAWDMMPVSIKIIERIIQESENGTYKYGDEYRGELDWRTAIEEEIVKKD